MPINGNAARVTVQRAQQASMQDRFRESLEGRTIEAVSYSGETLTLELDDGFRIAMHCEGGFEETAEH